MSIHDFGKKGSISGFFWATNERLVFSVSQSLVPEQLKTGAAGQLVAANIDGKNTRLIAGWGTDRRQKRCSE